MKFINSLAFISLIVIVQSCYNSETIVNQWRGVDRSGVYNESNLLDSWPEEGPLMNWETTEIGVGYGSPVVAKNKLLIVGTIDSLSVLFAFNLDGELQYKSILGEEWVVNFPGSRSTPTVFGNKVYVMTGKGDVVCADEKNGNVIWKKNVLSDFGGVSPRFGFSQSLVVDGNKVFCSPGGEQNNVIALNRLTGELIWSSKGMGERPGYNPAKLIEVGKKKIFVTFSAYHLMGFDAETGELLWSHEQINTPVEDRKPGMGDTHGNTVLFDKNILYYIEGDGNCAVALQLSNDGNTIAQLWNNAAVDNFMGGILILDNFIYSCSHSGKSLSKLNPENGAVVESLPIGRGTLIAADGKLFYYNDKGEVNLVEIKKGEMKLISKFRIEKGSHEYFAHPVIHDGVLYVRHGEFLAAYKISK